MPLFCQLFDFNLLFPLSSTFPREPTAFSPRSLPNQQIHAAGWDIDPELITRARRSYGDVSVLSFDVMDVADAAPTTVALRHLLKGVCIRCSCQWN